MALKLLVVVGLALASGALAELVNQTVSDDCTGEPGTESYNSDADVSYVAAFYGNGNAMSLPSDGDALLVPYALNKCQSSGPVSGSMPMIKFVCDSDGNGFYFYQYQASDVECQGQVLTTSYYDSSTLSAPFSFNCGTNDAYATFQFTLRIINSMCDTNRLNYFALNSCISSFLPPALETSSYSMYYCDETGAAENFFEETAQLCSSDEYCVSSPTYLRDECQVYIASSDSSLDILIKNVDCVSIDVADSADSSELLDLTSTTMVADSHDSSESGEVFGSMASTTTDAPVDGDGDGSADGAGDDDAGDDDDDDDGDSASSGEFSGGLGVMAGLSTVFLLVHS